MSWYTIWILFAEASNFVFLLRDAENTAIEEQKCTFSTLNWKYTLYVEYIEREGLEALQMFSRLCAVSLTRI